MCNAPPRALFGRGPSPDGGWAQCTSLYVKHTGSGHIACQVFLPGDVAVKAASGLLSLQSHSSPILSIDSKTSFSTGWVKATYGTQDKIILDYRVRKLFSFQVYFRPCDYHEGKIEIGARMSSKAFLCLLITLLCPGRVGLRLIAIGKQ